MRTIDQELFSAAERGDLSTALKVLGDGAAPNAWNEFGENPLHTAAFMGQAPMVDLLLRFGADPNAKDRQKSETPLHLAAAHGDEDTCHALISAGSDITAKDARGQTPLHAAAAQGRSDICSLLVEKGADPLARDRRGKTAISRAKDSGHEDAAAFLTASRPKRTAGLGLSM